MVVENPFEVHVSFRATLVCRLEREHSGLRERELVDEFKPRVFKV